MDNLNKASYLDELDQSVESITFNGKQVIELLLSKNSEVSSVKDVNSLCKDIIDCFKNCKNRNEFIETHDKLTITILSQQFEKNSFFHQELKNESEKEPKRERITEEFLKFYKQFKPHVFQSQNDKYGNKYGDLMGTAKCIKCGYDMEFNFDKVLNEGKEISDLCKNCKNEEKKI